MFAAACVPAYFLSALWLPIPLWVYVMVVIAAFSQLAGWIMILQQVKIQLPFIKVAANTLSRWILLLSTIALTIKLLLQLGSTIPSLSNIAFGFRPIVIGYLHLILLGVITLFLLGFMLAEKSIMPNPVTSWGIKVFTAGVIINELFLMTQGITAMNYQPLPFINEALLFAACIIFTGIILLNISQQKNTK